MVNKIIIKMGNRMLLEVRVINRMFKILDREIIQVIPNRTIKGTLNSKIMVRTMGKLRINRITRQINKTFKTIARILMEIKISRCRIMVRTCLIMVL